MQVFRMKRLRFITCLSIIFLVAINFQCYGKSLKELIKNELHLEKNDRNQSEVRDNGSGRDYENFKLTFGTYSEKDDLNRAVIREFGMGASIADWNDLKAITNIDAWISFMRLSNDQTFMVKSNGKFIYSGNRQYFVYYSTTGRPPAGFLVHDKISNKLFLGSWFGEYRKILVIDKGGIRQGNDNPAPRREFDGGRYAMNFKLTFRTYSEKDDLNRAVARELGDDFAVADWNDLKAIPNIEVWISEMRLRNEQSFFVTRDGKFIHSGNRQYNVQYFASGNVPANYLIHDQIGHKLFLGSWYDLNEPILTIKKGDRHDSNYKLTLRNYSEKENLDRAVVRELGDDFTIADWNDLKAIPDIQAWIYDMQLRNEQSFFVTRDGKFIHSGNRQYNVQYFASGNVPANYLIHDQIGHKLFLGSWYDLNEPILAIKKGDHPFRPIVKEPQYYDFIKLTNDKFSETQNLEMVVRKQYAGRCRVAEWNDLKALPDIDAWILQRRLFQGQTFFVSRNGKFTFSGKRQYFVYYSPTGLLPPGFLVHDQIGNKLFLGSWYGEKRQILVRDYRNK